MSKIFIADLHSEKKRKVTYGNPDIWSNKPLKLLDSIIKEESPTHLVLLGDIFDTANPDSLSYGLFIATIINVPNVWILEGNHDRPKVEKEYAFEKLGSLANVHIVSKNTFELMYTTEQCSIYGIGWCDTQTDFEANLDIALDTLKEGDILALHCNWADWGNEMDNTLPQTYYTKFEKLGVLILAGHEHTFHYESNFIHLGAIMPMTIGELGDKYYYSIDKGLTKIDHKVGNSSTDEVQLLREEPELIEDNKCYFVKSSKEVTIEDIKMEAKDLKVDILADFVKAAGEAGFSLDLLQEFIDVKESDTNQLSTVRE